MEIEENNDNNNNNKEQCVNDEQDAVAITSSSIQQQQQHLNDDEESYDDDNDMKQGCDGCGGISVNPYLSYPASAAEEEAKGSNTELLIIPHDNNNIRSAPTTTTTSTEYMMDASTGVVDHDQPSSSIETFDGMKVLPIISTHQSPDTSTAVESTTTTTTALPSAATAPAAPAPAAVGSEAKVDDALDELVGMGDNVIVERSPGGRYVRFMEKLGSGASKDVFRAYDTQEGIEVAWNVVNLLGIPKTDRNRIVNEVRLLEQLHHQNIISFHGSWVNRERQEVIFVTEILSSGTLKSFIKKVQVIRWKIAKRWIVQILKGLEYLHSRDPPVIHRDLKCENIFINGASGDLRIGDFGLSTVNRNGKVLSVLGTPEFMAPDMYEETSYDEKVDIYAFGMCLLEIFTKEIPYAECNNPAQIYKKVTAGEPPEVLCRLRSRHAREFVQLCLGYKDETTGKYIRPTATELLKHPFLEKRASDDDEVEVEPPLRERRIIEEGDSQSMSPQVSGGGGRGKSSAHTDSGKTHGGTTIYISQPSSNGMSTDKDTFAGARSRAQSTGSFDEDESDRFDQMPESEVNIRNVKVFMGRGQELKEDERGSIADSLLATVTEGDTNSIKPELAAAGQHTATTTTSSATSPLTTSCASLASNITDLGGANNGLSPKVSVFPLLGAASVDTSTSTGSSDVRQFVVTLPLEGQTQNVQFEFHLVNDDPFQVANEMVTELGLPLDAVSGISAIISSLANEARNNMISFQQMLKNDQASESHMIPHSQAVMAPSHPTTQLQQNSDVTSLSGQQPVHATLLPQVSLQPRNGLHADFGAQHVPLVPSHVQGLPLTSATAFAMPVHHAPTATTPQVPRGQASLLQQGSNFAMPHGSVSEYGAPVSIDCHPQIPQSVAPAVPSHHLVQAPVPMHTGHQGQQRPPLPTKEIPLPHAFATQDAAALPMTSHPRNLQVMAVAPLVAPKIPMHVPVPQQTIHGQPLAPVPGNIGFPGGNADTSAFKPTVGSNVHMSSVAGANLAHELVPIQHGHHIPHSKPFENTAPIRHATPIRNGASVPFSDANSVGPAVRSPSSASLLSNLSGNALTVSHSAMSLASLIPPAVPASASVLHVPTAGQSSSSESQTVQQLTPVMAATPAPMFSQDNSIASGLNLYDDDGVSEDESSFANELRKLDEDYQKNLLRTKKVFDNRMDNLQRSLIEKEVQHLRTLEKHEKERAAFEKRVVQEEMEHTRRIEQLQREWDEKRVVLARQKQLEGLRSRKLSMDGLSLSPASGVRSHSTSPILHADFGNNMMSLDNNSTPRPPYYDANSST